MHAKIRRTKDGHEATYERILQHPPERVWQAVAQAKGISEWFTPNELDPRPGGRYAVNHDHAGIIAEEEVVRYEPPRVFEHTWGKGEWAGGQPDTATWAVHPHEDGTRLVLTYRFRELGNAPGSLAGWHTWLDVLEAVLGGEKRADHAPPTGRIEGERFVRETPGKGVWKENERLMREYEERVKRLEVER